MWLNHHKEYAKIITNVNKVTKTKDLGRFQQEDIKMHNYSCPYRLDSGRPLRSFIVLKRGKWHTSTTINTKQNNSPRELHDGVDYRHCHGYA